MRSLEKMTGKQIRKIIKSKEITKSTAGMAKGYTQANLVILKEELAFDFLLFCQRNPKPCPVLEVTELGQSKLKLIATDADIRTDIPKYRVYRDGECVEEVKDILSYWEDDMIGFLLGCSFTFEAALMNNGIPVRHVEEGRNVPMYETNIACIPAGVFSGPMVVSMRPMKRKDAIRATQITSRFPAVHGSPVHIGDPREIGIQNIENPDFGEAVTIKKDEIPVFWACGVTPQLVAMKSKPSLMITHAPGCMFISDIKDESLSIL